MFGWFFFFIDVRNSFERQVCSYRVRGLRVLNIFIEVWWWWSHRFSGESSHGLSIELVSGGAGLDIWPILVPCFG